MRKLLILACLLAIPRVSRAQSNKAAWENLNALQPGQKIQVVDKSKGKHSGTFLSVDAQEIKLHEKSGDSSLKRENVARVNVSTHRARRHALLGLAIGAGAGAAVGAISAGDQCSGSYYCINPVSRGQVAAGGAIIGGLIGTVVGVLAHAHKTIYQAR